MIRISMMSAVSAYISSSNLFGGWSFGRLSKVLFNALSESSYESQFNDEAVKNWIESFEPEYVIIGGKPVLVC
jgi:hypothetical protein